MLLTEKEPPTLGAVRPSCHRSPFAWHHRRMRTRGLARIVVVIVAVLLAGLVRGAGADAAPVTLVLRPSVNQLYVLQATPGQALELVDGTAVVGTGTVDAAGIARLARAGRRRLHRARGGRSRRRSRRPST